MYNISRLPEELGAVKLAGFDPASSPEPFSALNTACVDKFRWTDSGFEPETFARVGYNSSGLYVLMWSMDPDVDVNDATRFGGDVYLDSCMEFFFTPDPAYDRRYINIEANARAVVHIGIGEGRENRRVLSSPPPGFESGVYVKDGELWALYYHVPTAFIKSEFPRFAPERDRVMRGNFFKCNVTAHTHYGMWIDTLTPTPDFHRPERFGEMALC